MKTEAGAHPATGSFPKNEADRMRRILVAALVLLLVPSALFAQGGRQGRGAGMGMATMNAAKILLENRAELTLTDDQAAKLQTIADSLEKKNAPFAAEMEKVRAAGGMQSMSDADREKMRGNMQQARTNGEAAQKEIDVVLTAEQKTKAEEILARNRPGRRGGGRA
jgi:Skp family chaperone for outer membrane proteins